MQTATTKADDRSVIQPPPQRRSDLFDLHFPRSRAAANADHLATKVMVYDPHFPANPQAKGSAHV